MRQGGLTVMVLVLGVLTARPVYSDPCGMVPPIYTGQGNPIERVGTQKTYVFHKNGIESIVIRPGFRGKVDQFGMLIPFPTPPAIRKMPDGIFPHVKASIDPPEVVVYVYHRRPRYRRSRSAARAKRAPRAAGLRYDQVKVLRQEAVGMYEVAVLAAGSASALKRWMDAHGYKYPKGMDAPANDYVSMGWCFVAVKTKVGQKKGVNPRPGMRSVKTKLPPGSSFNGHVQAMGFRFRTKKLVVPMRLSAFNAGSLRNIVYVLANGPRRIRQVPAKDVMRQVPGWKLRRNMTHLLPLRVIGGTIKKLRPYQRSGLKQRRNPKPHTKYAAELFATDILAARRRRLSHPYEETKKELLAIGERLLLRGDAVDSLNRLVLKKKRDRAVKKALAGVSQMTMSVIDADFVRDVLAKQNLTFRHHRMPRARNNSNSYNARYEGPNRDYNRNRGILYRGSLDQPPEQPAGKRRASLGGDKVPTWLLLGLPLTVVGLLLVGVRRRGGGGPKLMVLLIGLGLATPSTAVAGEIGELIKKLGKKKTSRAAITALVARGTEAVPKLLTEAFGGSDPVRRGWAIVCLSEIGGAKVDSEMEKLHRNPNHPALVRTWAAAARIHLAKTPDQIIKLAPLAGQFTALNRPLGIRLTRVFANNKKTPRVASQMLMLSANNYRLRKVLVPVILALGSDVLVTVLVQSKHQQVRRQAAAYLGTMATQGDKSVAKKVIQAYRFKPKARTVPWDGGPLFIPGIRWPKDQARELVGNLIAWHVWVDFNGKDASLKRQIHNNLRSLGLARAAGYSSPGWREVGTERWLVVWGKVVGHRAIQKMLKAQGRKTYQKYKHLLDQLDSKKPKTRDW